MARTYLRLCRRSIFLTFRVNLIFRCIICQVNPQVATDTGPCAVTKCKIVILFFFSYIVDFTLLTENKSWNYLTDAKDQDDNKQITWFFIVLYIYKKKNTYLVKRFFLAISKVCPECIQLFRIFQELVVQPWYNLASNQRGTLNAFSYED